MMSNETESEVLPRESAPIVRILATMGIVFVASFETWRALTSTISWRDWAHYLVAAGTIYFLSTVIKNGRWVAGSPTIAKSSQ